MRYLVNTRMTTDKDLSRDCPFINTGDIDAYQQALYELKVNIGSLNGIKNISIVDNKLYIESDLDERSLKETMKKSFQDVFCNLRFVNIIAE